MQIIWIQYIGWEHLSATLFHQLSSSLLTVVFSSFCLFSSGDKEPLSRQRLLFVSVSVLRLIICRLFSCEKRSLFFPSIPPWAADLHFSPSIFHCLCFIKADSFSLRYRRVINCHSELCFF